METGKHTAARHATNSSLSSVQLVPQRQKQLDPASLTAGKSASGVDFKRANIHVMTHPRLCIRMCPVPLLHQGQLVNGLVAKPGPNKLGKCTSVTSHT